MDTLFSILLFTSLSLLVLLISKIVFFLTFSVAHYRIGQISILVSWGKILLSIPPPVSIIVPAYNEELVLENCVKSLLKLEYQNYNIVIVDDGSTDDTLTIGKRLAEEEPKVSFYTKKNGGKAKALNYGITKTKAEIIVCIDSDSILRSDALTFLTLPFADKTVGAVGGNVKVVNRSKLIGLHQAVEYIVGLNLQRRAFSHIGCMQVISGAIGAFRRKVLLEVGGYSHDTLVEDMDVTIAVNRAGYQVLFVPQAVAYTEAPENIKDFMKQRYRWTLGGFKVIKKYRDMLFNPAYGKMGMIGLPYFFIFPWIDVSISILLLLTLMAVVVTGNYLLLLLFVCIMISVQGALIIYALHIDEEQWPMVFLVVLENIWYSHLINFVTLWAGIDHFKNKASSWNKVTRLGKNIMPIPNIEVNIKLENYSLNTPGVLSE
jgi:peptidoglycan-N-acetylglucosamine deacetylase